MRLGECALRLQQRVSLGWGENLGVEEKSFRSPAGALRREGAAAGHLGVVLREYTLRASFAHVALTQAGFLLLFGGSRSTIQNVWMLFATLFVSLFDECNGTLNCSCDSSSLRS